MTSWKARQGSTVVSISLPTTSTGRRSPRRSTVVAFLLDRRGETAIEYGLIASLVVVVILAGLSQFSGATNRMYSKITNAMAATP